MAGEIRRKSQRIHGGDYGHRRQKEYINRQSPRSRHQHHIIAANIDQSLWWPPCVNPRTSQGFIDCASSLASEMYHIPAHGVCSNKADLFRDKELRQYESLRTMYGSRIWFF